VNKRGVLYSSVLSSTTDHEIVSYCVQD